MHPAQGRQIGPISSRSVSMSRPAFDGATSITDSKLQPASTGVYVYFFIFFLLILFYLISILFLLFFPLVKPLCPFLCLSCAAFLHRPSLSAYGTTASTPRSPEQSTLQPVCRPARLAGPRPDPTRPLFRCFDATYCIIHTVQRKGRSLRNNNNLAAVDGRVQGAKGPPPSLL